MKYINYCCFIVLIMLLFSACQNDNAENPSFSDDEMPVIHMDWAGTYVYKVGDIVKFNAQVSPNDQTTCRWLVNDKVVSESLSIEYTVETTDPFTLRFEAERNGVKNFRTAQVTITKDFEEKQYNKVVMGALTTAGSAEQVQWDYVTHLMYSSLVVSGNELTLPDATALARLKTLVSLAHNNGVYVIVNVSGSIAYPAGGGIYNETAFNDLAIDGTKRTQLISSIKSFVTEYDLDGVNIYMNNLNNDAGGLKDTDQLKAFMNELGDAFPTEREGARSKYFVTASVPMAWNNDQFYYLADVPRLDWVNFMLFGGTDLAPVHHAPDWQINDNLGRFAAAGLPTSKALIGIGAFGIKYDIPAGTSPTWGNLDQFLSYPTYADILKLDASAPGKDMLPLASGLYYTGISAPANSVLSKAALVNSQDAKGMFIWTLDYDTSNATQSLTQAIYKQMNP